MPSICGTLPAIYFLFGEMAMRGEANMKCHVCGRACSASACWGCGAKLLSVEERRDIRTTLLRSVCHQYPNVDRILILTAFLRCVRGDWSDQSEYRRQSLALREDALKNAGTITEDVFYRAVLVSILHSDRTIYEISEQLLDAAERGEMIIPSDETFSSAKETITQEVLRLVSAAGLRVCNKPEVVLPTHLLRKALEFAKASDLFIEGNISPQKETNAKQANCCSDPVVGLIDCTLFGSAKDSILITARGVYFSNNGRHGFISYADLADTGIARGAEQIIVKGFPSISLSGSSYPVENLYNLLQSLRELAKSGGNRGEPGENSRTLGLSSVAGMHDLKETLFREVVGPFTNPEKYRRYRLSIPNGILLYGPPGCGKTYIAQRIAEELKCAFHEVSPSTFASSYVHGTTQKIQVAFEVAEKSAPCLIFIDEFEGIAPNRNELDAAQQFKAEEVNELLVQISNCADKRILLVAATNAPWKIDPAIQRTGRIDRKIYVGPPDQEARCEMLRHHLSGRPISSTLNIEEIAGLLSGYASSDLTALCDAAAHSAMTGDEEIAQRHFVDAMARVNASISAEDELLFEEWRRKSFT